MSFFLRVLVVCSLPFLLNACSTLSEFVEPPKVSITNIEVLPNGGLSPRFAVSLNILNQNPVALPISGLAYDINLNGFEVFNGATSDIPSIPAYGEVPLTVEVGTNLLQSIGFITSMLNGSLSTVNYEIDSDVSVSGFSKKFSVSESGQVPLTRSK